jgi:hypothetical protein
MVNGREIQTRCICNETARLTIKTILFDFDLTNYVYTSRI